MIRIGEGIELSHRGERDRARELFAVLWDDIGAEAGEPLHSVWKLVFFHGLGATLILCGVPASP